MHEAGAMTTKMKERTRAEAKNLMWEYYRDNKELLPSWIKECREEIIENLQHGMTPRDSFKIVELIAA